MYKEYIYIHIYSIYIHYISTVYLMSQRTLLQVEINKFVSNLSELEGNSN